MSISERKVIPLCIDSEAFKPKKEKEMNEKSKNLQLDLNLIEEDDQNLKLRDIPRRKSSTGSTTVSKTEEPSELFSCLNSPIDSPQNTQQNEIFFGRDRNCSNPIFNFYQYTEENLRETYTESSNYKNTKNYINKEKFLKRESPEQKPVVNNSTPVNNNENNNPINNILKNTTTFKPAPFTAFIPIQPKIFCGGKGKFDMPMYYVSFCGWDGKLIIYNHIKNYSYSN